MAATNPSFDTPEPKAQPNEPPPPYPGFAPSPNEPPPAYPGIGSTPQPGFIPPPGANFFNPNNAVPLHVPNGDCPNCQVSNLVNTPDVTLILCLFLMAFLFTPFVLCCIPCAFKRQCTNCGYISP